MVAEAMLAADSVTVSSWPAQLVPPGWNRQQGGWLPLSSQLRSAWSPQVSSAAS